MKERETQRIDAENSVVFGEESTIKHIPEEVVPIDWLKDHPRNYQEHPPDEIVHIKASIEQNGIYKNIVVANDYTILAGHGVTKGCRELGLTEIPVRRLPISPDDKRALQVLAGDNEIRHLAEIDDRALTNILKDLSFDDPTALLGTGYDEMMVANLDAVTRPPDDMIAHDEGSQWVGLPEYESADESYKVIVHFDTDEDRREFLSVLEADQNPEHTMVQTRRAISMWWPLRDVKTDRASVKFEADERLDPSEDWNP